LGLGTLLRAARGSGVVAGTCARAARVVTARRWLTGELDGQVALPIAFVCDALGLDAGVLAAAVAWPRHAVIVRAPRRTCATAPRAVQAMPAPPEESQGSNNKTPKPGDGGP
jgi:hypothetical protein